MTIVELGIIEHMLGKETRNPGYRNYFVSGKDAPDYKKLKKMEEKGLVRERELDPELFGTNRSNFFVCDDVKEAVLNEDFEVTPLVSG